MSQERIVPRVWVSVRDFAEFRAAGRRSPSAHQAANIMLVGLFAFRPLGVAAAIGLIAFFIGAVITHVRAQVFYNIAFPAAFLVLAVLSLGVFVAG